MAAINPVAELTIEGDVATVTINSPPVNALSQAVRDGLKRGVEAAEANGAVKAIVIICAGRTFIAGADITEFGKPHAAPYLPDVLDLIENASKPVVAALHGTALGGGFEVALTAHYRIAVPSAKCGLPEIKLGLIPGAGGTQRLPRLVGVEKALDVILSGTPFGAREAKEWGVVDELAEEGKLHEVGARLRPPPDRREGAAEESARPLGQARAGARPSGDLRGDPQGERAQIPRLRGLGEGDRVGQERGRPAVRRGHGRRSARCSWRCLRRPSRRRSGMCSSPSARRPRSPTSARTCRRSRSAASACIGAGTMGGGIAMNFLSAGIPVTIVETSKEALDRGVSIMRRNYENTAKKGRLTMAEVEERMGRLTPTLDFGALGRGRSRDRGGVREHGHQEERVRAARRRRQARRDPRLQHLLSRHRRDRGEDQAARGRARHAFLLARQRDAAARDRARGEDVEIGSGDDRRGSRRRSARSGSSSASATASSATACWPSASARR